MAQYQSFEDYITMQMRGGQIFINIQEISKPIKKQINLETKIEIYSR